MITAFKFYLATGRDDDARAADDAPPVAREILAAWLAAEVGRLPEPMRSTLRATELEGRRHQDVAEAEGVSVSAIKSRVSRGRRELERRLDACCEVELDARRRPTDLRPRASGPCEAEVGERVSCG